MILVGFWFLLAPLSLASTWKQDFILNLNWQLEHLHLVCDHSFCYSLHRLATILLRRPLGNSIRVAKHVHWSERSLLITLFAFSDNNPCLGCGPLSIGTAAAIRTVGWSKQRHICGESLRLEADQWKHSMLGAGQAKQLVIKIVLGVLSTSC